MYSHDEIPGDQYAAFFHHSIWMAGACNCLGKLDEALNLLRAVEQLFQLPDVWQVDKMDVLLKHVELQSVYSFLTNTDHDKMFELAQYVYQEAEKSWAAADFIEDTRDALDVARTLCFLGQAHYYHALNTDENDYIGAQSFFQQSLELCERMTEERKIVIAPFFDNPPTLMDENGPYDYALDYFTRLIDRSTSEALFSVGLIHESLEELTLARDFYQRSLNLALHSGSKEVASYASSRLAHIGESEDQQLVYALQSLHLREEIGFKRMLPYSHFRLSEIYLQQNHLEKAQEHCQIAFHLAEDLGIKHTLMTAFFIQGEMQQQQNKLDEARQSFTQSFAIAKDLDIAYGGVKATKKLNELGS